MPAQIAAHVQIGGNRVEQHGLLLHGQLGALAGNRRQRRLDRRRRLTAIKDGPVSAEADTLRIVVIIAPAKEAIVIGAERRARRCGDPRAQPRARLRNRLIRCAQPCPRHLQRWRIVIRLNHRIGQGFRLRGAEHAHQQSSNRECRGKPP